MEPHATGGERGWNVPAPLFDTSLALLLTLIIQVVLIASLELPVVPVALLITVPLSWRRHSPLPVFAAVAIGVTVTFTTIRTSNPALIYPAIMALLIAAYSVGVYSRRRLVSAGVLATTATLVALEFGSNDQLPPLPGTLLPYVIVVGPFLMGQAMRGRQLRVDAFRERAMRLEQEQEFAARVARNEERARIARELHDVVAHTVSVMVVQAGAARRVVETTPDQAIGALCAVENTGREAMTELRHLLGALTPEDDQAPLSPQPGIAQLPTLVQRVRDAGLPAELQVTGSPRMLPPGIDLTAYRIVQEALTNTIKHAGPVRAQITLDYRDDALKVEVLDEGTGQSRLPGMSGGHGLAGMRDRVALYGGTLEAGPRLGRGFAVRAWLPLAGDQA